MSTLAERLRSQPPVKLYRIGEISRFCGLSRQTVHNYTVMGLIRESDWSGGGHRLYDESVFSRLVRIEELKNDKTLREIRIILDAEAAREGPVSESA